MAQLEAIRHEMRSISFMNPGPMTRNLLDNALNTIPQSNGCHLGLRKLLPWHVVLPF